MGLASETLKNEAQEDGLEKRKNDSSAVGPTTELISNQEAIAYLVCTTIICPENI
jgi:hypothetical protein